MTQEYTEGKYGFEVHIKYISEAKRELRLRLYDAQSVWS